MYASVADLKLYLGIDESGDDALLVALSVAAQAYIDGYCRQSFEADADSTRYFDAKRDVNGAVLYLDAPLAAITTITNGNSVVVAADKYVTEPRNGGPFRQIVLKSNAGLTWTYSGAHENAISIVGKWAYSVSAPADIVQATLQLVAYMFRQKDSTGDLDRAVLIGNNTILPAQIPRDFYQLLRPYVRLVL